MHVQVRHASHASQGNANRAARGAGKRLGAKKGASEPVVPGNIIFRQRGSLWHPGENCVMGRDHTISALQKGFVRYYRDPARHPSRKFIGVVFQQNETLPRPINAPRRRRLGMVAVPRQESAEVLPGAEIVRTELVKEMGQHTVDGAAEGFSTAPGKAPELSLRHGYQYRPSNYEIGKIGQRLRDKFKNEDRRYKKLVNLRRRTKASGGLQALAKASKKQAIARAKDKGKGKAKAKGRPEKARR